MTYTTSNTAERHLKDRPLKMYARKIKEQIPIRALACVMIASKLTSHKVCLIFCILFYIVFIFQPSTPQIPCPLKSGARAQCEMCALSTFSPLPWAPTLDSTNFEWFCTSYFSFFSPPLCQSLQYPVQIFMQHFFSSYNLQFHIYDKHYMVFAA